MISLRFVGEKIYSEPISALVGSNRALINTINAHSYNTAQHDAEFATSLLSSDILLPDGISIVWALRFMTGKKIKKIAGTDLFLHEMSRLNEEKGSCFFLGSSQETLSLIKARAHIEYPNINVSTYSPPYKAVFTDEENLLILRAINSAKPDVLFVGMTAPKQEKWAFEHFKLIEAKHVCTIGAVFDFFAGTVPRAPGWMISLGLEWLYRLLCEPARMWRRYLIGNCKFVGEFIVEYFSSLRSD
jgi:N-acetylglucosaminyldiphosphoundecaprenol N-acetyl-beta-D-mannosaminyltransferase